jgi:hypothetical protein
MTNEQIDFIKNNTDKTPREISVLLKLHIESVRYFCRKNEIKLKKGFSGFALTEEKEKERRKKLGNIINKRYDNGWKPVCGRAKKINYEKNDGVVISVDGSWELRCCIYLDSINVTWERNLKRFEYINLSGNTSKYTPDFYVKDWDSYIEIKGYETDLDRCKWKQFKYNLLIWNKQKLKELNILNIDISKYKNVKIHKHKCKNCGKPLNKIYKTGLCRECYILEPKNYKPKIKNYCSCGSEIDNRSKMCKDCYIKKEQNDVSLRKVKDRPDLNQLLEDVKNNGYLATGRKYGVSDKTIRKWIKKYVGSNPTISAKNLHY